MVKYRKENEKEVSGMSNIPQENGKCPHCGADIEGTYKNVYIYGSPIRTCKKCKKQYWNKRYHEIAIDGIRPEDLSTKGNGKMILGTLIASIVLIALNVVSYSMRGRVFKALLVGAVLAVIFFFGMIIETIKVKSGKKAKELEKKRQESCQRLQNREYADALVQLGYQVPVEYLKD